MPTFLCWLFLLLMANESVSLAAGGHDSLSDTAFISKSDGGKGYTDIVGFKNKFIAVGTDGRIDCISESGEKIPVDNSCLDNLTCAFSNKELLIAAGDHGTILYSTDGRSFYRAESRTKKNIHGITFKNGLLLE
jgi:hypothetical protein